MCHWLCHCKLFTFSSAAPEPLVQIQFILEQSILEWRGFIFIQRKGHAPYWGDHIVTMPTFKIFSRTTWPFSISNFTTDCQSQTIYFKFVNNIMLVHIRAVYSASFFDTITYNMFSCDIQYIGWTICSNIYGEKDQKHPRTVMAHL